MNKNPQDNGEMKPKQEPNITPVEKNKFANRKIYVESVSKYTFDIAISEIPEDFKELSETEIEDIFAYEF